MAANTCKMHVKSFFFYYINCFCSLTSKPVAHDIPTEYLLSVGTAREITQNRHPGLESSTEEDLGTQMDKLADGL